MIKINMLKSCVFSHLLYVAETWTMKAADKKTLGIHYEILVKYTKYRCWKDKSKDGMLRQIM